MIPRGVVAPLGRLVTRTLAVALLCYLLLFLLHLSFSVGPHLTQLTQPRLVPPPASSSLLPSSFACHECSPVSSRRESGVYTCHDCNRTLESTQPVFRPVSNQTAQGLRLNLIDDTIAETRLFALFHCQWHSAWWCHAPLALASGLVLDTPQVSFHPVTLLVSALLLSSCMYWILLARGVYRELTRERAKRLQAAYDDTCVAVQSADQLCGGSNTLHTQ